MSTTSISSILNILEPAGKVLNVPAKNLRRTFVSLSISDVQGFSGDSKTSVCNEMDAFDVLAICLRRRDNKER